MKVIFYFHSHYLKERCKLFFSFLHAKVVKSFGRSNFCGANLAWTTVFSRREHRTCRLMQKRRTHKGRPRAATESATSAAPGEFFKTASAADWSACKLSAGAATTIEIHARMQQGRAGRGRVMCAEHGTRITARAAAAAVTLISVRRLN